MPVTMRFTPRTPRTPRTLSTPRTPGTKKTKPTIPRLSLPAFNDSLSSSTKKKIANFTRNRVLKRLVKKFKTKQETKKRNAATTIQERARAKIQGKKTRKEQASTIKQINDNLEELEATNECAICYYPLINKPTTTTKCKHTFHRKCLNKWLRNHNTCPNCREIIPVAIIPVESEKDEDDMDEEDVDYEWDADGKWSYQASYYERKIETAQENALEAADKRTNALELYQDAVDEARRLALPPLREAERAAAVWDAWVVASAAASAANSAAAEGIIWKTIEENSYKASVNRLSTTDGRSYTTTERANASIERRSALAAVAVARSSAAAAATADITAREARVAWIRSNDEWNAAEGIEAMEAVARETAVLAMRSATNIVGLAAVVAARERAVAASAVKVEKTKAIAELYARERKFHYQRYRTVAMSQIESFRRNPEELAEFLRMVATNNKPNLNLANVNWGGQLGELMRRIAAGLTVRPSHITISIALDIMQPDNELIEINRLLHIANQEHKIVENEEEMMFWEAEMTSAMHTLWHISSLEEEHAGVREATLNVDYAVAKHKEYLARFSAITTIMRDSNNTLGLGDPYLPVSEPTMWIKMANWWERLSAQIKLQLPSDASLPI